MSVEEAVRTAMAARGTYPRAILGSRAYDAREAVWDIVAVPGGVTVHRRHYREK